MQEILFSLSIALLHSVFVQFASEKVTMELTLTKMFKNSFILSFRCVCARVCVCGTWIRRMGCNCYAMGKNIPPTHIVHEPAYQKMLNNVNWNCNWLLVCNNCSPHSATHLIRNSFVVYIHQFISGLRFADPQIALVQHMFWYGSTLCALVAGKP